MVKISRENQNTTITNFIRYYLYYPNLNLARIRFSFIDHQRNCMFCVQLCTSALECICCALLIQLRSLLVSWARTSALTVF